MKQLTEVKDGQKVLVLFDAKIYEDDLDAPIHLEIDGNSAGFNLSLDFYDDVTGQKNTLYDFNEVMNAKKSELISKDELEIKIKDILLKYGSEQFSFNGCIATLRHIFQSYHPESFNPEVGKEYLFYNKDDKKKYKGIFRGYEASVLGQFDVFKFIEPIQKSDEELKAIELLKSLGYEVNKK